ncbi:hypothetical protein HNP46_002892 [Pseudomonas nitritireducens]|uniref:Uncharacterized protein n=1 Tax=Pseudomonas nitroreducens TaxID=46680 RepID=A0A7W7KJM0_PSENT|nr:hypothetical protein [Pseudomonas nitritireducens]MBB4864032.1 hypothetical protein [Pseudomonas nitritireducens]
MAIIRKQLSSSFKVDDQLSKILGDKNYSRRRDIWLWCFLDGDKISRYDRMKLNFAYMRDDMADAIYDAGVEPGYIHGAQNDLMLPDEQLAWISSEPRQLAWLKVRINSYREYLFNCPPAVTGRDEVIAMVDCLRDPDVSKAGYVQQLKRAWDEQVRKDKILDWIKSENAEGEEEACGQVWSQLNKHHSIHLLIESKPSDLNSLLRVLDGIPATDTEKAFYVSAARKAWGQVKRRRKSDGKSQYNFTLTDRARKRLDALCDKYEIKRPQVIEILLLMEEEKGLYLEERMRILRGIES